MSDGCYNVGSQSGRKKANGTLYRYTINSNRLHGETEDGKEISLKKNIEVSINCNNKS